LFALKTFEGLIILATGGEKPHVGAVAIAIPRPSLKNPKMRAREKMAPSVLIKSFPELAHDVNSLTKLCCY
jgi:hypothetical protein